MYWKSLARSKARERFAVVLTVFSMELSDVGHVLGKGVARRGGLQRVSEARPMEVRSDRTPQPARERDGVLA